MRRAPIALQAGKGLPSDSEGRAREWWGTHQVTQACGQALCLLTQCRRPHTLSSDINYALKLPLAYGTGECLSLVFESVICSRSAPR